MKKRGTQRRVDTVSMTTENRGMVFRDRPVFFMMTPPISIPTATAGRFRAPEDHNTQLSVDPVLLHKNDLPTEPTYEEAAVGGRGAELSLEKLVEERGKTRDHRGEAALGQNQNQEERTQQETDKHPGKH